MSVIWMGKKHPPTVVFCTYIHNFSGWIPRSWIIKPKSHICFIIYLFFDSFRYRALAISSLLSFLMPHFLPKLFFSRCLPPTSMPGVCWVCPTEFKICLHKCGPGVINWTMGDFSVAIPLTKMIFSSISKH